MDFNRFIPKGWMASSEEFDECDWVIVGIPFDGTCSNRPGTRFGPEMIRNASWGLETYSPIQDKDLEDISFYDAGELEFPLGNRDQILNIITESARDVLNSGKRFLGLGGEHLVTYPVVEAYLEKYPNLALVHFDAHADLREDYLGETLSHASVMRRIVDKIGPDSIYQIGIRSGTREEFQWMREHKTLLKEKSEVQKILEKFKDRPIFISIDIDVLDPSLVPGTGTPEAGGLQFNDLMDWLLALRELNIVGADLLELAPHYDPTGVSSAVAAKIVRELLLLNK